MNSMAGTVVRGRYIHALHGEHQLKVILPHPQKDITYLYKLIYIKIQYDGSTSSISRRLFEIYQNLDVSRFCLVSRLYLNFDKY
jgi:hypothetical protein